MTAKSEEVNIDKKENIEDDISEENLDNDKMAKLRAKLAAKESKKEENMPPNIVAKRTRSIKFGIIGSGQGGSRLASSWHKLGYDAVAINTAQQDLADIELPEANKLLLNFGLGGAGKDLDIGHQAAEAHRDAINQLVYDKLADCELLVFCTSLGGGSGAGSAETIIDILAGLDRPVVAITVLPMSTDDAQTKHNAIVTLSKFAKMVQNKRLDNLIVVDNARIETIYSDVSALNFFDVSNKVIIDPIDQFNTLSSMTSSVKGLDPTEFGKIFTDGGGLTVYGKLDVPNYEEDETAIAEAVVESLNESLLASGFNLKEARYAGAIFVANEKVWKSIPNASVNYAMSMIGDVSSNPVGVFKGIYTVDMPEDVVRVYSMFSGLGLPSARVDQLKTEAKEKMAHANEKDEQRNLSLKLDAGEETVSAADAIKKRIAAKKSSFGKLHNRAIVDRRK